MKEDIRKLVDAYTDPAMSRESRASVLAYARGRLDTQKELKAIIETVPEEKRQGSGLEPLAATS